ncbi:hypothetical protein ACFE04_011470 [Oxalis oulophora]
MGFGRKSQNPICICANPGLWEAWTELLAQNRKFPHLSFLSFSVVTGRIPDLINTPAGDQGGTLSILANSLPQLNRSRIEIELFCPGEQRQYAKRIDLVALAWMKSKKKSRHRMLLMSGQTGSQIGTGMIATFLNSFLPLLIDYELLLTLFSMGKQLILIPIRLLSFSQSYHTTLNLNSLP